MEERRRTDIQMKSLAPIVVAALATLFIAFNHAFGHFRATNHISEDLLDYFVYIHDWFDNGFPITGHTLHPTSAYIELAIETALSLATRDFETYNYFLALTFAVILFFSLWTMLAVLIEEPRLAALAAAAAASLFYLFSPNYFIMHLFMENHAIVNMTVPIGLIFFIKTLLTPAPMTRWGAWLFGFVFVFAISDPFILTNFVMPALAVCCLLTASARMDLARLAKTAAILIAASIAGLLVLGFINANYWPHRIDVYPAFLRFIDERTVDITPIHALAMMFRDCAEIPATVVIVSALAASVFYILYAWRTFHAGKGNDNLLSQRLVAVLFGVFCTFSCFLIPVFRGAFANGYEYRYIVAPDLLAFAGLVSIPAIVAVWILKRGEWSRWIWHPVPVSIMVALLIAAAWKMHYVPLTVDNDRSQEKALIACATKAEQNLDLHHGIASIRFGKVVTASHYTAPYRRPYVVVLYKFEKSFSYLDTWFANAHWFSDKGKKWLDPIDYVAWDDEIDPPEAKQEIIRTVGEPDRTVQCPIFSDSSFNPPAIQTGVTIWAYKDKDKLERLRNLVMRDNNRGVFWPRSGENTLDVDPVYGMVSPANEGELKDGRRVWDKDTDKPDGRFAFTKPIFLPTGHYAVKACIKAEPAGDYPAAAIYVSDGLENSLTADISANQQTYSGDFRVRDKAGPSSGYATTISLYARKAEKLSLCGLEIKRIDDGFHLNPFNMFQ